MLKKSIFVFILILTTQTSFGEERKSEELALSKESMEMMKEFDEMFAQYSYMQKKGIKVMNDPELIKSQAKYAKNLYEAFIAEGFSKEQAFELVKVQLESGSGKVDMNK